MGSIINAECGCGFKRQMYLGGGMRNFETHCAFPLYCGQCKILFAANLFQKQLSCPDCGGRDVVPYDDERVCQTRGRVVFQWAAEHAIGRALALTDGGYLCPQCGRFTLSFSMAGCWD